MAFNLATFKTRTLTAIVFAVVMLAGLFTHAWSFFLLFSIIHFGCWWEYFNLLEKQQKQQLHIYFKLGLMVAGYSIFLFLCNNYYTIGSYGLRQNFVLPVSAAGMVLMVMGIFKSSFIPLNLVKKAVWGVVYISLSWGLLMYVYTSGSVFNMADNTIVLPHYFVPMIIIFSIWINDTMAYIVGSFIGKTPLSSISPKKTWEGTIGGVILAAVVMAAGIVLWIRYNYSPASGILWQLALFFAGLVLIAAVTGTLGDLLESKLKRLAGVKDSGSFMPGHGGFLDRFDSLLIAIPAVWLYLLLVKIAYFVVPAYL